MPEAAQVTEATTTDAPDVSTRDAMIQEAIRAAETESAPPHAAPEAPPTPAVQATPELKPDAVQQATEHAKRLEADRKFRERERAIKEREAKIAAAEEAQKLLETDPIAFAKKYGGEKFGQRYVTAVTSDGKPDPMAEIEKTRAELAAEKEARIKAERDKLVSDWRGGARQRATTDDKLALVGFYTEDEVEEAAMEYAGRHYALQSDEERKLLNPSETLDKMQGELVSRLTRLSKTTAGQQLLRSLVQAPPPAPPVEQRTDSAAAAPRTLTSNLDATPAPTRKQSGPIVPPSSNDELIREAMKAWQ